MNAQYHETVHTPRARRQAARYCTLLTLISKLTMAVLLAAIFVVIKHWT